MSTKRLQRTVIEGGRGNTWERRNSHNEERAAARDFCKRVMIDPNYADEEFIEEKHREYKEFRDKLSPMYRWLESQVGRPWADVRSEIFTKFDTRTTAGRHITFDHLLQEIVDTESGFDTRGHMINPNIEVIKGDKKYWWYRGEYYVDENGILQGNMEIRRHRYNWERITDADYQAAEELLNGRIIGEKGGKLHWFIPMDGIWKASWKELDKPFKSYDSFSSRNLKYYILDNGPYQIMNTTYFGESPFNFSGMSHGDHWEPVENPFSFRQRGELTPEEVDCFKSLKSKIKKEILEFGKGR